MDTSAEIGVFGGSGFYALSETEPQEIAIETPYGSPSDTITLTTIAGKRVAFLPRHGRKHQLPPHKIPYRANLWAFQQLGVQRVIAPNAVGSLQAHIAPGHFVINDQFVDRTTGRADTFYDGPQTIHVSTAHPYCPHLRTLAIQATRAQDIPVHDGGTCVIIQGPRFSTRAESEWFSRMGWDIVNMTQYPEVALARELAMCYVNISLITDYDAGVVVDSGHVEAVDVLEILRQNTENVKRVIHAMLETIPGDRRCDCADALKNAQM
ncbi:5'-methylthioadenosine phosphorylase [Capsulimonas corticalis]|uniref:S-methyl-5'-thioadenosine phosphorylase n=1 Tax=Capsulimonas corticalis TaxID=2219043 RepID=A0A402D0W6_9BACT|nr:S-methyl-5'-thioadenosine phosphorylase [Capsulimonas corticalis]BDI31755.1 5'-methylthioadenosine phosphorylase [Capsulimonas corticalis]